ncbi:MAG: PepSY domain-containing protein [Alkalibacterium sp.]
MSKGKAIKFGLLSLSAGVLLAACNGEDEPTDMNPIEEETTETDDTEPIEEQPAEDTEDGTGESDVTDESETDATYDSAAQTDSPGIEGMTFSITLDEAIDLFYETFGSEDTNIEQIEFDDDNGRYLYEFDGWDGEFEYELDIDAETGEIVKQEQEQDSETDDILELEGIVTPNEAMDAALEASGSGYVEEWKLEVENGQTIYDIDIEDGEDQKIDAVSGDVL